jgi:hypothetical protein
VAKRIIHFGLLVGLLAAFGGNARAQSGGVLKPDTATYPTYAFLALGGFIPAQESYRINYSTSLGGLPIELSGGLIFPVTENAMVPLTIRYIQRKANFVSGTKLSVISIEPGVRLFLEREHKQDLRLFAAIEGLFARASASGTIDATDNGSTVTTKTAEKDYLNYGLGIDIGVMYPLTRTSALDGIVHIASYLGSSVDHGGIGNIGGVSLVAAYRVEF